MDISSGNALIIMDNNFNGNTAYSFGGAIYVNGTRSSVNMTGSNFVNNRAITEGGRAIYSNG